MRGNVGSEAHLPHEFDGAFLSITVETVALSFSLVGHSRSIAFK